MSILIIKSGTTSIAGGTVKGDFTYFSATTKGLGGTIDTGFWSGVDPTCDGYTVYKIGGQHGWAAMVATGREQLNYYLQLFGGTGTTTDENVTWATNSNNIFIHTGSTGPCPTPTINVTPTPTNTPTSSGYVYLVDVYSSSCVFIETVKISNSVTLTPGYFYATIGLSGPVISVVGTSSGPDYTTSIEGAGYTTCGQVILPTPTPTPTPSPTPVLLNLQIANNASLDISVTTIQVEALLPSVIGGTLPNTPGNTTTLGYGLSGGTYEVRVYYNSTLGGQRIAINSPLTGYECQNVSPGTGVLTFSTVGFDNIGLVQVYPEDGAC